MRGYQKNERSVNESSSTKVINSTPSRSAIEVIDTARLLEIAEEGFMAMAYEIGLEAMSQILEQDVEEIAGPKGKHNKERAAYRHGTESTTVVYGDRKVSVKKPRVRTASGEVQLPSLEYFKNEDSLNKSVLTRLLSGISTRKYSRTVAEGSDASCVSKSDVSRRFNVELDRLMEEFFKRKLNADVYPVIMVDGMQRGGMTIIAALGIRSDGKKEVLGLVEGGTENSQTVKYMFGDLIERGLRDDVQRLFVIDGAKALSKAVKDTFGDNAEIQRCQVHKKRNVLANLPESEQANISIAISNAYLEFDYKEAYAKLKLIADNLERRYPSAAGSLREGLEETLTVSRLGVPGLLRKTLSNTNAIESANATAAGIVRRISKWRDGEMLLKHMAAGFMEAERGFRRVQGYRQIPFLIESLRRGTVNDSECNLIAEAV
jgi:transposase-like protein